MHAAPLNITAKEPLKAIAEAEVRRGSSPPSMMNPVPARGCVCLKCFFLDPLSFVSTGFKKHPGFD